MLWKVIVLCCLIHLSTYYVSTGFKWFGIYLLSDAGFYKSCINASVLLRNLRFYVSKLEEVNNIKDMKPVIDVLNHEHISSKWGCA